MSNFVVNQRINLPFRQQKVFVNEENLKIKNTQINVNKSQTNEEQIQREFGKDITNSFNDNSSFQNKNSIELSNQQQDLNSKQINVLKKSKNKEDLANKLKNYSLRIRNQNLKVSSDQSISSLVQSKQSTMKSQTILEERLPAFVNNNEILNEDDDIEMAIEEEILSFKKIDMDVDMKENKTYPNPQMVEEYIPEIYEHLRQVECDYLPKAGYMKSQTDINEKMRGILIDWLVEVHLKFKLLPETLFLTVNLIDRYLEKKQIMRTKLQLIGVTSMLIACKYEEIYAPEVRDFVYITDKAYTKEEILASERDVLDTLNYDVTLPSSLRFLEIYQVYLNLDETSFMFSRYLLELLLIDYKMIKYNPSLVAATAAYISVKISKRMDARRINEVTGYGEEQIKDCLKDSVMILDNVEKNSLQAIRKKFSKTTYLEVAKIKSG